MYSCVGVRAGRFVCFVLTLAAVMSGRFVAGVHGCCTTSRDVRRVGPRVDRFVVALESLRPWLSGCSSYICYETGGQ